MYWHDGWDCPWSGKVAPADVELLQASDDPEEICALVEEGDRRQRAPVASDGR